VVEDIAAERKERRRRTQFCNSVSQDRDTWKENQKNRPLQSPQLRNRGGS